MKKRLLAACLCMLLLAGCAVRQPGSPAEDPVSEAPPAREEQPAPEADAQEPESEAGNGAEAESESLFETVPASYLFCSGAGGWSTELTIRKDGSFYGLYHDADMGVSDPEKFPGGTRYICNFSGTFTQPERVNEFTYSMRLGSIELEHPADGTEEYADDVRYIYSGPYGLEEAEELLIYLPGAPVAELPEGAVWAARGPYDWQETAEGTLGLYEIYNVNEGLGFVEYPIQG